MPPSRKTSSEPVMSNTTVQPGLYVIGSIANRTRRYITTNANPNTEIVTYTILDDHDHRFFVDDFAPASYYEVSQSVTLPVYIKPYKKKNGDAAYTLCIQKNYHPITKGEAF